MSQNNISRAEILIQQKKYPAAELALKEALSSDPANVYTITLLAEVNLQQGKVEKARNLVNTAIGLNPHSGHLFYLNARILIQQDDYDGAEKSIAQALEAEPADADYHALSASIKLTRKQYQNALDLADSALELDPGNLLALNIRSTALLKLDNKADSFKTIEGALREDPDNAYTHSNYGWGLLEKGDHKKALQHFREALKNDPDSQFARSGMVEALKANNLFYRLFLKYSFWISNLTSRYQWAVIIGFYVGFRALRSLAANNKALQPYLTPLILLLALIAFSTWVITPVSNLFLRLSAFGKHLLSKKEISSSNFVGMSFGVFLIGITAYLLTGVAQYLVIAVFGFVMMVPYGAMFSPVKSKSSLVIYAGAMTVIGLAAIVLTFSTGKIFNMFSVIFMIGFIAFQWVANFLSIKQSNV